MTSKSRSPALFHFEDRHVFGAAIVIWIALWAFLSSLFPAFPVDETRYLTVAWEMRQSGHLLLLTLNGDPYSHKPPLLFWLINLLWTLGGTKIAVARVIPLLCVLSVALLTRELARRLYPQRPSASVIAPVLMLACPGIIIYGNLIMFDMLLTVWLMAALITAWKLLQDNSTKSWLLFGLFTGLGVLTKGPVILIYVGFPVLLGPFLLALAGVRPSYSLVSWYAKMLLALGVAAAVALAWAVPAALEGGPEYARMIFWKQSAGRMVEAFAHRRPLWFYVPFVIAFFLPFYSWPPFWQALRGASLKTRRTLPALFLLTAVAMPFLSFTLISSKQVHYMLPLIPAACILIATRLEGKKIPANGLAGFIIFYALLTVAVVAAPYIGVSRPEDRVITSVLTHPLPALFIFSLVSVILLGVGLRDTLPRQALALMASMAIFHGAFAYWAAQTTFPFYDLRPVAEALQVYKDKPLAYAPRYAGELTYMAKLDRPFAVMEIKALESWFRKNPEGVALVRYSDAAHVREYRVLQSFPYKADRYYALIRPR